MIKKRYYLYRIFEDEGKKDNYIECSYLSSDTLGNLKRLLIVEELFHYEFEEEWEATEEELGITRSEMIDMDILDILDKLHDKYFLVAEYNYIENGTSYGPAIPYND